MVNGQVVSPGQLDQESLTGLADQFVTEFDKSVPVAAAGHSVSDFLSTTPRLSAFGTPLLVLDDDAMDGNAAQMATWCERKGVGLAPHGKTTMAPALWDRQLRAGAWGITVATVSQLRVAAAFGVSRVLLANALVDPAGLAWAATTFDARPESTLLVWADSVATVEVMNEILTPLAPTRPIRVLVERGCTGGRTGARTLAEALEVAAAISASPHLELGGAAGWEGGLGQDASPGAIDTVRSFLLSIAELHQQLLSRSLYPDLDEIVVTAGGSAYFDDVVDVLGPLATANGAESGTPVTVLLRSGGYLIHDDGFYRTMSPFSRAGHPFRPAMHLWARVVSRPEPGLALLDAGRRDVPFDAGLPEPQLIAEQLGGPATPIVGASIAAVNDQHAFLRMPPETELRVGQVVRLGLSHPCTAFDKWRLIPVVRRSATAEPDPRVVDLVRTYF